MKIKSFRKHSKYIFYHLINDKTSVRRSSMVKTFGSHPRERSSILRVGIF